jgi:hypothetical protein
MKNFAAQRLLSPISFLLGFVFLSPVLLHDGPEMDDRSLFQILNNSEDPYDRIIVSDLLDTLPAPATAPARHVQDQPEHPLGKEYEHLVAARFTRDFILKLLFDPGYADTSSDWGK